MANEIARDAWVNVQAAELSGETARLFSDIAKAREAFKAHMVALGRKANKLSANETLVISHKPWGFSMAKVEAKASGKAKAGKGGMFDTL